MDIDKLFESDSLDGIADNVFGVVNNSVSEVKEMQRKKVAENVQLVVNALKKIESDISSRYDSVGNALEKRIITIKDGRDGADGSDGRNGRDGKNGRDGAPGPRGADGKNGLDGADGIDGVSVTNAHIDFDGSLVISLSSGQEINVGEVVAPALAEQIKVITNGGGTSQSVIDTLASLQAQITAISGASIYKGLWNASTNTPTLASGVGTSGNFYIVSVAGSTNLDGITNWGVGDWAIYNGTAWQRVEGGAAGNFTTVTASSLTSGRVTYAGTAGLLQDSANLTFNGTTLTANTIGAFTLSGTVSGGGNQLNNVIIGTTTPLAGAFTTLSASSSLTMSISGAGSQGGSVANTNTAAGAWASWGISNGTRSLKLATLSTGWSGTFLTGGPTTEQSVIYTDGNIPIVFGINSSMVGQFTSTGLNSAAIGATTPSTGAFTTLSATGLITSTLTSGEVMKFGSTTSGTGSIYMDMFNTSGGMYLGIEGSAGGSLWTNIPAYATGLGGRNGGGGISFSANAITQHMLLTTSGLAVTGTLSATGNGLISNGVGAITNPVGWTNLFQIRSNNSPAFSLVDTNAGGTSIQQWDIASNAVTFNLYNATLGSAALTVNATTNLISITSGLAVTGTLTSTLDATIYGLTVGRGGGSILTNTAFGSNALQANTSGTSNVAIGNNALKLATITLGNTAVGSSALAAYARTASVTGRNTAIGQAAMSSNTDGVNNTAVGYNAFSGGTGSANTCIGLNSGSGITSGNSNVILGAYAGSTAPISATGSNYVVLSDGDGNIVASSKTAQTFALQGGTLSAGTGIAFPATQSASTDANTLDDYEEGTWTPTDGSGASLSFTVTSATYTKIGRIVNLFAYFAFPSNASTNPVLISGLPFTVATNTYAPVICETDAGIIAYIRALGGGTNLDIRLINGDTQVLNATMSTRYVICSMTYQTT